VGCPTRLGMVSMSCEMDYNGEDFWLNRTRMSKKINDPDLALEEVFLRIKFDR
jgi:hypothetical protein